MNRMVSGSWIRYMEMGRYRSVGDIGIGMDGLDWRFGLTGMRPIRVGIRGTSVRIVLGVVVGLG